MSDGPSWIPEHLRHLRTDRRGIPVPWINMWGDPKATPQMMSVAPDATVRMDALYMNDEGQDVPDFTKYNYGRQRLSMAYGLCQVCGREVPWDQRILVWSSISTQVVTIAGEPHVALTEPWLDPLCAEVALTRCPALIRRRSTADLAIVVIDKPRELQFTVATGWVEGPLEAQTKAAPVAFTIKALVPKRIAF